MRTAPIGLLSAAMHAAALLALRAIDVPAATVHRSAIEVVVNARRPEAGAAAETRAAEPAENAAPPTTKRSAPPRHAPRWSSDTRASTPPRAAAPSSPAPAPSLPPAPAVAAPSPSVHPSAPSPAPAPSAVAAVERSTTREAPGARGVADVDRGEGPSPKTPGAPNLFSPAALTRAVGLDVGSAPPASAGYRPRQGVGGASARGGIDPASFLAEDAARERASKGAVAPHVREMERRLGEAFDPPFSHVVIANKLELFHKQFIGSLKTPPKIKELSRGEDPSKETSSDKEQKIIHAPFFLGRRVEVYARQRTDGTVVELAIRKGSGFHAFDEEALAAVAQALAGRPPPADEVHGGEVRTLWQLDATGYIVISPNPTMEFDESTGKTEWFYPSQKKVDHHVRLLAVY